MKKPKLLLVLLLAGMMLSCQQTKKEYLEDNRVDLASKDFDFPQTDFNIIGFGAYHGSAKTEVVELSLLQSLTKNGLIKYYFPEVDFSMAHYFNQYMNTGDTVLLKDLVVLNGVHSEQERTIEFYEKWKRLKQLNDGLPEGDKIEVVGIEWIRNYKYVSKHLLELVSDGNEELRPLQEIKAMVATDTTSYARGDLSMAHHKLKALVDDYEGDPKKYLSKIEQDEVFKYLIKNIKLSFDARPERERIIYENYVELQPLYQFDTNKQFMRIGFFHLEKSREGKNGYPSLFARLIENKIYSKEKVLSVIGYFSNSEVVYEETYDTHGNYTGYKVDRGFWIGDYEKEYFRGIQLLKDAKISDKTLFRLNKENSPYTAKEPDLIEIVMTEEPSNGEAVKGMSTLDFMDYAVLISDSKASAPIFELDKK